MRLATGAAPQSPSKVDVSPPIDDLLPQSGNDGNADRSVFRLGGRSPRTRATSDDVRDQKRTGYSTHANSTCIVCLHAAVEPSRLVSYSAATGAALGAPPAHHVISLRRGFGRYRGIADSSEPSRPADLWVHGLSDPNSLKWRMY
jgi:hypothetical protein